MAAGAYRGWVITGVPGQVPSAGALGGRPGSAQWREAADDVRAVYRPVGREKESAIDARDYEQAASLRSREKELLASKAARQEQWAAGHPALPVLAERYQQLTDEIERLRALLRQHGIDPQDKPA